MSETKCVCKQCPARLVLVSSQWAQCFYCNFLLPHCCGSPVWIEHHGVICCTQCSYRYDECQPTNLFCCTATFVFNKRGELVCMACDNYLTPVCQCNDTRFSQFKINQFGNLKCRLCKKYWHGPFKRPLQKRKRGPVDVLQNIQCPRCFSNNTIERDGDVICSYCAIVIQEKMPCSMDLELCFDYGASKDDTCQPKMTFKTQDQCHSIKYIRLLICSLCGKSKPPTEAELGIVVAKARKLNITNVSYATARYLIGLCGFDSNTRRRLRYKWVHLKEAIECKVDSYCPGQDICERVVGVFQQRHARFIALHSTGAFAGTKNHKTGRIPHAMTHLLQLFTQFDAEHKEWYKSRLPPLTTPGRLEEVCTIIDKTHM